MHHAARDVRHAACHAGRSVHRAAHAEHAVYCAVLHVRFHAVHDGRDGSHGGGGEHAGPQPLHRHAARYARHAHHAQHARHAQHAQHGHLPPQFSETVALQGVLW